MNPLSCCSFPTRIIFVDDNSRFLDSINGFLDEETATYGFFHNPYEALKAINGQTSIFFDPPAYVVDKHKIENLGKILYQPNRYEEISTVIVDYSMPSMNGLMFFQQIQNPRIRRVLYTGMASEDLAIDAFNDGQIDGYISKGRIDQDEQLLHFIAEGHAKYFQTLTEILTEPLVGESISDRAAALPFFNSDFIAYFTEVARQNNVIEYYFDTRIGGFLCLSPSGKFSILFVYPEEVFDSVQSDLLESLRRNGTLAQRLPPSFRSDIEQGRQTVRFPLEKEGHTVTADDWMRYAQSVVKIDGRHPCYAIYVPDGEGIYDHLSIIRSFDDYKKARDH